ncbi:MAG: cache domain-containing protein, partial [Bacteroidales bacterium]|nr:cache domain-containing protein [Bacteroidales bacterium]
MEHLSGKRSKKIFLLKIDLPALIAVVFFAGLIFFYLIPGFEKVMMERKRNMIHEITSSAYSLLDHYHSLEMNGTLGNEEAKEQARAAINSIRYGESLKDYFWITDLYPRMIDHPYRPDLNGKDLTGFRDSNGKALFVEFVKAVSSTGESYVDYMWQWNDDSTRIIPKLSYVRLYEPWGWIIGTGIYIDDVRSEIRRMEFRALIISGLIGLIIIVLLSAITQQSHRLEKKRSEAEAELQKSRELYRTLAEVASEGVIIWSRQGLQANKTLLTWLGYTEKELNGITFHDILSSTEMKEFDDPELLYDDLGARRFVECTLRMKSGNQFNSHADFSGILLGNMRAVLVVLRPAAIQTSQSGFTPEAPLLKYIGTGFFSFTYGRKSRFINATLPVGEMLGFSNIQQLHSLNLDAFFVNPFQLKAIRGALAAKEEIHGREVLLRNRSGDEFSALISMMVVESTSGEKWCEGTIEYLASAAARYTSPPMDLDEYSASYIMETPVTTVMNQPLLCHENMTVNNLMTEIKTNNADVAIVINSSGDPLGIIDAKTVGLRLAEGDSPETEIFRWMTSPPDYIHHTATVGEAFGMIQNSL